MLVAPDGTERPGPAPDPVQRARLDQWWPLDAAGENPEAGFDEFEPRQRAEVGQLRADKTRLATERDILRSAAKYFAGETNW